MWYLHLGRMSVTRDQADLSSKSNHMVAINVLSPTIPPPPFSRRPAWLACTRVCPVACGFYLVQEGGQLVSWASRLGLPLQAQSIWSTLDFSALAWTCRTTYCFRISAQLPRSLWMPPNIFCPKKVIRISHERACGGIWCISISSFSNPYRLTASSLYHGRSHKKMLPSRKPQSMKSNWIHQRLRNWIKWQKRRASVPYPVKTSRQNLLYDPSSYSE